MDNEAADNKRRRQGPVSDDSGPEEDEKDDKGPTDMEPAAKDKDTCSHILHTLCLHKCKQCNVRFDV